MFCALLNRDQSLNIILLYFITVGSETIGCTATVDLELVSHNILENLIEFNPFQGFSLQNKYPEHAKFSMQLGATTTYDFTRDKHNIHSSESYACTFFNFYFSIMRCKNYFLFLCRCSFLFHVHCLEKFRNMIILFFFISCRLSFTYLPLFW